jgi:hypothetical protein
MSAYDQFPAALLLVGEAAPERVPLAILVVFGSAKLLAELFERLGQPGIVGEIIAGILIGPGVLGWIETKISCTRWQSLASCSSYSGSDWRCGPLN